jgi:hypothetical protein
VKGGNDHRIGSHRDHRKGSHLVSKKCPLWGVTSLDRRGGPRCRVRLGGGELVAPAGGSPAPQTGLQTITVSLYL